MVAVGADVEAAVAAVDEHRPDVVLLDLSLPGCTGADAVHRLLGLRPGSVVVALADDADEVLAAQVREAGAVQLLVKDADPDDLLAAVRAAVLQRAA